MKTTVETIFEASNVPNQNTRQNKLYRVNYRFAIWKAASHNIRQLLSKSTDISPPFTQSIPITLIHRKEPDRSDASMNAIAAEIRFAFEKQWKAGEKEKKGQMDDRLHNNQRVNNLSLSLFAFIRCPRGANYSREIESRFKGWTRGR